MYLACLGTPETLQAPSHGFLDTNPYKEDTRNFDLENLPAASYSHIHIAQNYLNFED
jgi:hypothetical protein